MKIHVMHAGRVRVSPYLPFGGDGRSVVKASGVFLPSAKRVWLPVSAYLIESPHGLVLLDAGWARAMSPAGVYDAAAQKRHLSTMLYYVNQGEASSGQTVAEQLAAQGIDAKDLACILLSHWDCDHASGLRDVAEGSCVPVLVAREELEGCGRFSPVNRVRFRRSWLEGLNLRPFDYAHTGAGPQGKSFDLFGDGSIELVDIPGHTPGMFATVVRGASGQYANLVADGAYGEKNWAEMVLPGISMDRALQRESLAWIRETSLDPKCVRIFANHDSDVGPCTLELS